MRIIDFHSHILPQADHGSDGIEMSMQQVRYAVNAGVTDIIATPHFYNNFDTPEAFADRCSRGLDMLNEEIDRSGLNIKIHRGCELNLQLDLMKLSSWDEFRIAGTDYVLVEFPFNHWAEWFIRAFDEIRDNYGLIPIVAHIDRYPEEREDELFDREYLVQINASVMSGFRKRHFYKREIQHNKVHFLGSDSHASGKKHYENFAAALRYFGNDVSRLMKNAETVLNNGRIL